MHDLVPQAGYAPRGQRAIARIAARRAGANMISAIANSGQMSFRVFDGRFTADVFIDFLRRLIATHPERKIYRTTSPDTAAADSARSPGGSSRATSRASAASPTRAASNSANGGSTTPSISSVS
jgi:hypothetical protein